MLNALSVQVGGDEAGALRARRSLEQQGFFPVLRFAWEGGELQGWSANAGATHEDCVRDCCLRLDDGFACTVGPLWYRGRYGVDALRYLIDALDVDPGDRARGAEQPTARVPRIDECALRGNFVVFLQRRGSIWLINDPLGLARLYCSDDRHFYCTSWLATCAYVGRREIDEQPAIEYVLQGASHSDRTVANGVSKLPLGNAIDLVARRAAARFEIRPSAASLGGPFRSLDEAVENVGTYLRSAFGEVAAAFPGRTSAALSGGFDSRLIVAGLLANDERPALFVYGGAGSDDVSIAQDVAQCVGLAIAVVDKDALNRDLPTPDVDGLWRSALFFDGLPNDGIYDHGADRRTRLEQSAGGRIALNGGGGEIFRNFFHLPDRSFRPLDIVDSFYRGFDPRVFRSNDGLSAYRAALGESIARSIGARSADERVARTRIELAYPLFRCHHWMGLNNSVALRSGAFGTPLVDLALVQATAEFPLEWKSAGLLESRLITHLHRRIAGRLSAYGFRFDAGPDASARRRERLTCMRPVFARPFINAARRRLHNEVVSTEFVSRCRALLPGEWRLDPLLDLARLSNEAAFARALSVELVLRKLAP